MKRYELLELIKRDLIAEQKHQYSISYGICAVNLNAWWDDRITTDQKNWINTIIRAEKSKRNVFYLNKGNFNYVKVYGAIWRNSGLVYIWNPFQTKGRIRWLNKQIKLYKSISL